MPQTYVHVHMSRIQKPTYLTVKLHADMLCNCSISSCVWFHNAANVKKLAASVRTDDSSISSLQEDETNKLRVSVTTYMLAVYTSYTVKYCTYTCTCWFDQEIEAFEATIDELREKRLSLKKKLDDQVTSCTFMFGYMHTCI